MDAIFDRDLIDPRRRVLLSLAGSGVDPGASLGFHRRALGPAIDRDLPGRAQELVGRVDAVRPGDRGVVYVPAAAPRLLPLRAPRDDGAPINRDIVDGDAEAPQHVRRDAPQDLVMRQGLCRHADDGLAGIAALPEEAWGRGEAA